VTDYGFEDPQMLPYSMAAVSAIVIPLGVIAVWLGLKPYRASIERTKQMAASN
jgi:hypothetical protein